jgi:hypothetical protein
VPRALLLLDIERGVKRQKRRNINKPFAQSAFANGLNPMQ